MGEVAKKIFGNYAKFKHHLSAVYKNINIKKKAINIINVNVKLLESKAIENKIFK